MTVTSLIHEHHVAIYITLHYTLHLHYITFILYTVQSINVTISQT